MDRQPQAEHPASVWVCDPHAWRCVRWSSCVRLVEVWWDGSVQSFVECRVEDWSQLDCDASELANAAFHAGQQGRGFEAMAMHVLAQFADRKVRLFGSAVHNAVSRLRVMSD